MNATPRRLLRLRVGLALLAALAAGGLAFVQARDLGPYLEIVSRLQPSVGGEPLYRVSIDVRGGETVDRVRVQPVGDVTLTGRSHFDTIPSGTRVSVAASVVDSEQLALGAGMRVILEWRGHERTHEISFDEHLGRGR